MSDQAAAADAVDTTETETAQTTDWRAALPEDLRGNAALADFKDLQGLAKSYVETKKMVGQSLRIPSEEAGEADWAAFRTKLREANANLVELPRDPEASEQWDELFRSLGKPEAPDAYSLPEEVEVSEDRLNLLREASHRANLTETQFRQLVAQLNDHESVQGRQAADAHALAIKELQDEWGMAYSDRVAQATAIARNTNAPASLLEALEGGNASAEVLRWVYDMATSLQGEGRPMAGQRSSSDAITPAEATERANELLRKLSEMDRFHQDYDAMLQRMVKYREIAAKKSA